jgi:holo-[acyl-carrier protein] synthase
MIKNLGTDIIEIERIRQSFERHGQHFLDRLFTQKEQDYCYKYKDPVPHFAGRFAAKEAIAKALSTGFGEELSWLDIEIMNDSHGKPIVTLKNGAGKKILLSISHCESHAIASAILIE